MINSAVPIDENDSPPHFTEARNRRQKVRSAGLDPDYWYPVAYDRELKNGGVLDVTFWGTSIAVFRGHDGLIRAIENRCAHRQIKLSLGGVKGCNLVCAYHGWEYDGAGKVVRIPHDLFGKPMPSLGVPTFPVQVRYGLIWVFPGDPELATKRLLPEIPELEGPDRWSCVPIDFTWKAHHSMILDNVSDFTHEYLHRKYRPFSEAVLNKLEPTAERVLLAYHTKVGTGRFSQLFVDRKTVNTNYMELCYEYPYQWSNTDNKIKHWCFVLPIDATTSRSFFLFYFRALKVPVVPLTIPRWLMSPLLQIANKVLVGPLLQEDGWAVEHEMKAYKRHFNHPIAELNPAVHEFQKLTVRKWEEYLARCEARGTLPLGESKADQAVATKEPTASRKRKGSGSHPARA